jgi:hypothetical protein
MVRRVFFALVPLVLLAQINIVRPPEPTAGGGGASVFLNHFYLVLDSQTFEDIKKSDFLKKDFAPFENRRTIRTDRSYSGIYFYGANTYFEFFDAAEAAPRGMKEGDSGLAFGVENPNAFDALRNRTVPDIKFHQTTITRQYGDDMLPWFYELEPLDFPFRTFVMLYNPSFLSRWNPSSSPTENTGVTRKEFLERYKSVLEEKPKEPLLQDVAGITLALPPDILQKLSRIYAAWGMRRHGKANLVTLEAQQFALRLIPETDAARGIQEVDLRLNASSKDQQPVHFGKRSALTFKGKNSAIWTF